MRIRHHASLKNWEFRIKNWELGIMIFKREIIEAYEEGDNLVVTQGQDISEHLRLTRELREHDDQHGISPSREFQHVASMPVIVADILQQQRPGIFEDRQEFDRWLASEDARPFRVARLAPAINGKGIQIIVK